MCIPSTLSHARDSTLNMVPPHADMLAGDIGKRKGVAVSVKGSLVRNHELNEDVKMKLKAASSKGWNRRNEHLFTAKERM